MVLTDGLRRFRATLGDSKFKEKHVNVRLMVIMIVTMLLFLIICAIEAQLRLEDYEAVSIFVNIP